jgi:hypothetical protein
MTLYIRLLWRRGKKRRKKKQNKTKKKNQKPMEIMKDSPNPLSILAPYPELPNLGEKPKLAT